MPKEHQIAAPTLSQMPVVNMSLGIRKPPEEVFRAMVDPAITSRFWFSKSSGPIKSGASVTWEWELRGVEASLVVDQVVPNRLVEFRWGGGDDLRTVTWRFVPWKDGWTYFSITEEGFVGTADEAISWLKDTTAGWALVLSALKAFLEHDVVLEVVADAAPV